MFKRIIVPLDGSGRAEKSLPLAARLARISGGSIFLVRVVDTSPTSNPSAPGRPLLVHTVGETDRAQAESYLQGIAQANVLAGLTVHTEVPVGLVAPSILTVATEKRADIILICSHGYTGVTRWWMLGSVAAKVARFASMPVLVLREGGPLPQERRVGERTLRVLVPLDGSDDAKAALVPAANLAADLAAPGRGELHLSHIVQSSRSARQRATQDAQASQNMAKEYLEATIRQLSSTIGEEDGPVRNIALTSSVTVEDDIAQGIINVAENGGSGQGAEIFGGCDVIALTTYGYSGRQHWVGSVTERVLDTSRMPLLIVSPTP